MLSWGGYSAKGPTRSQNEDRWRTSPFPSEVPGDCGLFAVADGMGAMLEGSAQGGVAIEAITHYFRRLAPKARLSEAAALEAYRLASQALRERQQDSTWELGTCTLSTVMVQGRRARLAWLGDVRVLLARGEALTLLSTDHTMVQAMVAAGRLSAEEALEHPHRDVLLRVLPSKHDVPESALVELELGDRLVLMSDGCWRPLSAGSQREAMEGALLESIPQRAAEALVRAAHEAGGRDNAAALVVAVG